MRDSLERRSRYNTALLTLTGPLLDPMQPRAALAAGLRGRGDGGSWRCLGRGIRSRSAHTRSQRRRCREQRNFSGQCGQCEQCEQREGQRILQRWGGARRQTHGWCRWSAACACGVGLREAHGSRHRPRSRTRSRTQTTGNRGSLDSLILLSFFLSFFLLIL